MRAIFEAVVRSADEVVRNIVNTYLKPDESFVELRDLMIKGRIDLLPNFSSACHDELEEMWTKGTPNPPR
jgi:hypothetical protein